MIEKKEIYSEDGFTLIEVLIAVILLSFLMISVYTIVDNSSNTIHSVTQEDRDFIQIETALSRLDKDFNQIYSPLYYGLQSDQNQDAPQEEQVIDPTLSVNFPLKSETGLRIPFFDGEKKYFSFFSS